MEECRGISFVDDVTWRAEGQNIDEVVRKLEQYAATSPRWADNNAVRFETSKTEAMLFSRRRKHWRAKAKKAIRVGDQTVHFSRAVTRWPGIWLGWALTLRENRRRCINQVCQAEPKIRRLMTRYGGPPASARKLQEAIVRGTLLCAAELTWNGRKGMEGEHQAALDRTGQATPGALQ